QSCRQKLFYVWRKISMGISGMLKRYVIDYKGTCQLGSWPKDRVQRRSIKTISPTQKAIRHLLPRWRRQLERCRLVRKKNTKVQSAFFVKALIGAKIV